ncbi:unnamed protein product, partial [Ilex paraguariensis]
MSFSSGSFAHSKDSPRWPYPFPELSTLLGGHTLFRSFQHRVNLYGNLLLMFASLISKKTLKGRFCFRIISPTKNYTLQ